MMEMPPANLDRSYLIVRVGGALCGLPVDRIRKVVRALPVHAIPGSAAVLLGLSQLGGEPIGVLDLGRLLELGVTGTAEHGVTIVTRIGPPERTETVGLAADEALQIACFQLEEEVRVGQSAVCAERAIGNRVVKLVDLTWFGNDDR
jgi:chemotaxis signal transduction protein